MKELERIRTQFRERFGEQGYSAYQIEKMLMELGFDRPDNTRIRRYMIETDFAVNLEKEGIYLGKIKIKHLMPESKLEVLIRDMKILATMEEMRMAAVKLGYRKK